MPRRGRRASAVVAHSSLGRYCLLMGKWKLIFCPGSGGWSKPRGKAALAQGLPEWQLYDLSEDPKETTNLLDRHPEVVQRGLAVLRRYVESGRSTPGPCAGQSRRQARGGRGCPGRSTRWILPRRGRIDALAGHALRNVRPLGARGTHGARDRLVAGAADSGGGVRRSCYRRFDPRAFDAHAWVRAAKAGGMKIHRAHDQASRWLLPLGQRAHGVRHHGNALPS